MKITPIKRFFNHVQKTRTCWIFTGGRNQSGKGYGQFHAFGEIQAHRVSWVISHGKIPANKCVCHKCDNIICVRPTHLFLGTNKENTLDSVKKGRFSMGESHHLAKLKKKDIFELRKIWKNRIDINKLSKKYRVNPTTIYRVFNNETWKHI